MAKDKFNFGERVKVLLNKKGVSHTEMLKELGMINQRYYDWCNKGSIPSVLDALKIADYFGITVEELIRG